MIVSSCPSGALGTACISVRFDAGKQERLASSPRGRGGGSQVTLAHAGDSVLRGFDGGELRSSHGSPGSLPEGGQATAHHRQRQ